MIFAPNLEDLKDISNLVTFFYLFCFGVRWRHLVFKRRDAKTFKMDKIINLGIPHIGEQIFESIETEELIEFLKVSET